MTVKLPALQSQVHLKEADILIRFFFYHACQFKG